ncbi:response regulator [Treponema zuelzerae]|uniref:Sensory/regulatory protein RpfC n=1 Tax=Teretinema zuelzerae TaxID=156 RepID=A0AAE3EFH5_9SPIR|nr:response regulator [Teretinema zuelzerae]MCD1653870.1 response regulator [Teretinema zuelzerae]
MARSFENAAEYLASARIPVLVLDSRGIPLEWNAAAEETFPLLPGKPGEPLSRFVTAQDSEVDEIRFSRLLSDESPFFVYDFSLPGPQNGIQWFKLLANRQQNGEYLVFIDDINRQKQKESHLVQAKQDAEKASVTRSQFLANVSHEIRTPIQTIIGMMELLGDTKLDEEQTEYVRQVRFSADVMLTLVNDLLDITKAEAGQMKIENIDFVLSDTIERSVDLVSMEAHKKGLEICIDIDPGIPLWVIGDPNRLQQVILNLVKNAVKFTASGQVVVHAELRKNRGEALLPGTPEEMVHLEVIDSGIGISEQARANLFTQFYQADSSTTRKYGGTGLGLAISKTIVDLMEGRIGIRGNPTGGSVFWFEIPLVRSAKPEPEKKLPQDTKVRFLLVDDNVQSRSILARMLVALGFKDITLASNGKQALEQLHAARQAQKAFDIVFIDMIMPEMDGWRLAAEINRNRDINQARLYLMVPEGSFGAEAKMKLLKWFNGYLYKPVKRRMLEELLREHWQPSIDLEVVDDLENPENLEEISGDDDEAEPTEQAQASSPAGAPKTLLARAAEIVKKTSGMEGGSGTQDSVDPNLPGKGLTILVVEDHPVNRKLLSIFLEKAGAVVVPAEDGLEATEMIAKLSIDLVFMDIQMPRMNGYEASEWMREKGYDIPIIACTASAQPNEKEQCIACGMTDILPKPYRRQDVLDLLHALKDAKEKVPMTAEPAETFNRDLFFDIVGGDMETGEILLREYLSQTEMHLKIMQEDLAALARDPLRKTAHLIKGSSLNITAQKLAAAAQTVELGAETLSPDQLKTAVDKMTAEFSSLKEALKTEYPS